MRLASIVVVLVAQLAHAEAPKSGVERLRSDGRALTTLCRTPWVQKFLRATDELPHVTPRPLLHDPAREHYYSEAEAAQLPQAAQKQLVHQIADEEFYYTTHYGSPLAYCRALDLVGVDGVAGRRVLDFGFGLVTQLRLLALLGADVTGVDVDPMLPALYREPGDQGAIGRGRVTLVSGVWPGDRATAARVGDGYDLIVSKNTLKNGYVHPAEAVKARQHFTFGVDDESFVRTLYRALKPGGRLIIFNISPAPNGPGRPYRAWADGRTPYPQPLLEQVGFRVLAFDRDDSPTVRAIGRALAWDQPDGDDPGMDLDHDLFACYTLLEKPDK
jgi:SAM-dependent methyltransferase